jgi:hypothetical protein
VILVHVYEDIDIWRLPSRESLYGIVVLLAYFVPSVCATPCLGRLIGFGLLCTGPFWPETYYFGPRCVLGVYDLGMTFLLL